MVQRCVSHNRSRRAVHGLPFGGVLLIGIDDRAYAMSYGGGYALIPDKLKDRRFGMSTG
jgi:uncharacterized protein (TIGR04141 family)